MKIFSGNANRPLAQRIADYVGVRLGDATITAFPDQETFVRQGIESGRYHTEDDAIAEALALGEDGERKRAEFRATLVEAKDSIKRNEGRLGQVITEAAVKQLAEEVKQRGRARLEAQRSLPR